MLNLKYNSKKYKTVFYIILYLIFNVTSFTVFASTKSYENGYAPVKEGRLYYQTHGSAGSPIIVLHGGPGGDHTYFLPQMLRLAKNHLVTFYDQRGSGKSLDTPLVQEVINLDQFVEDLEALRKHLGYEEFTIIGYSWGGRLAMEYAIKYPNRIDSMILASSSSSTYLGQQAYEENFSKQLINKHPELANLFDPIKFAMLDDHSGLKIYKILLEAYLYDKSNIDKVTLHFNKKSFSNGLVVAQMLLAETWLKPGFDLRPRLRTLTMPALILHGVEDPTPLWSAIEMQKALPNAELYAIPKCGHLPFVEQPEEFFEKIEEFLD